MLILVDKKYGGSFANLIRDLQQEKPKLTALDVVLRVVEVFPSFRDVTTYGGREGRSNNSFPVSTFDALTSSVLPQKSPNPGSGNMGRILPLSLNL